MPTATSGSTVAPIPAGVQHGICYSVIDIGTQPAFGQFPARRKVKITWELPHERGTFKAKDGSSIELPRAISKDYTLSTDKKANLRHDLEAWRGRPFTAEEVKAFEVGKLIGANCQLNVVHKPSADGTKIYANVAGIMPLGKGMTKLATENPTMVFDIPKDGTISFPLEMPEWIVNQIKQSEEYQHSINPERHERKPGEPTEEEKANLGGHIDEDVPF